MVHQPTSMDDLKGKVWTISPGRGYEQKKRLDAHIGGACTAVLRSVQSGYQNELTQLWYAQPRNDSIGLRQLHGGMCLSAEVPKSTAAVMRSYATNETQRWDAFQADDGFYLQWRGDRSRSRSWYLTRHEDADGGVIVGPSPFVWIFGEPMEPQSYNPWDGACFRQGETMRAGDYLVSQNSMFMATLGRDDGVFRVSKGRPGSDEGTIYKTKNKASGRGCYLQLNRGRMEIFNSKGTLVSTTGKKAKEGATFYLYLRNDGNLICYEGVTWFSPKSPSDLDDITCRWHRNHWYSFPSRSSGGLFGWIAGAVKSAEKWVEGAAGSAAGEFKDVGEGIAAGAEDAAGLMEKGAEEVVEGAVEAGKYISRHACQLAVTSVLTAAVDLLMGSEEEAFTQPLDILAASADDAEIRAACTEAGGIGAHLIWKAGLKDVAPDGVDEDLVTAVLAWALYKYVKSNGAKFSVVSTLKGGFMGTVIALLSMLLCTGKLPASFKHFQASMQL